MARTTDKRIRLINAAKVLIHQQGFNLTTLADIAQEADVPLGNVYYYFKTKEAIGDAVISKMSSEWAERLSVWSENSDPLARLVALVQFSLEDLESVARYGCPMGGLCQELGKQGGTLSDLAAKLLHDLLEWTESQFKALGVSAEKSSEYALQLVSSIQGAHLLTHAFKEPKMSQRQAASLERWLESITNRKAQPAASRAIAEEA